jgi:NADH-quinone oxidoreductase subunit L
MSSLLLLAAESLEPFTGEPSSLVRNSWLIVVLPLLSAVVIASFGRLMPMKGAEVGIGTLAIMWVMSLGVGWETFTNPIYNYENSLAWSPLGSGVTLELGMLVDGLTGMMLILVTTVSLMVHVYSREYMHGEERFTYFYAMLSLFTFSMLVLVISNNTLQGIVGWELVGLCSFLLIGFYWKEKPNQDAANKAFLTTKFADIGLIVGVIVLSAAVADLGGSFAETPFNLTLTNEAAAAGALPTGQVTLGMLLIFLGCMAKSGQMPLHVWLPDAMAGPTPVSALIHAATMVTAGIFFIARLYPTLAQSFVAMNTIAVVGVVTLLLGGLVALVQDDIKKVLAYSTVSQLGYMMAALGVGSYTAGVFHLFTHGFFKALLFLGSGSLIHAVHSNNMSDMGGMRKFMPTTFWTFLVGSLALAGFPLTAGFFSKDEILVGASLFWAEKGYWTGDLVYWVGLLGAAVTTFYMARAIFLIFFGEHRGPHHDEHGDDHGGDDAHAPEPTTVVDAEGVEHPVPAGGAGGGHGGTPNESGRQILVPLVLLAVASFPVGFAGGFLWDEVGGSPEQNFETWTATELIANTKYPFGSDYEPYGEVVDGEFVAPEHGGEEAAAEEEHDEEAAGSIVAAPSGAPMAAAAEGEKPANKILHGAPEFHLDVFLLALAAFLLATGGAYAIYGRGKPERDPTMHMGGATTLLVNKYYLDDVGYAGVVVPVRDKLAHWASQSSNDGRFAIDKLVGGVGAVTKRVALSTYRTLDQKIIDGSVNGAAFSAAWWSERLKRLQSGDVQRYAGALVAGTVVLILVIAASV